MTDEEFEKLTKQYNRILKQSKTEGRPNTKEEWVILDAQHEEFRQRCRTSQNEHLKWIQKMKAVVEAARVVAESGCIDGFPEVGKPLWEALNNLEKNDET